MSAQERHARIGPCLDHAIEALNAGRVESGLRWFVCAVTWQRLADYAASGEAK
jgi:hypothetical protein